MDKGKLQDMTHSLQGHFHYVEEGFRKMVQATVESYPAILKTTDLREDEGDCIKLIAEHCAGYKSCSDEQWSELHNHWLASVEQWSELHNHWLASVAEWVALLASQKKKDKESQAAFEKSRKAIEQMEEVYRQWGCLSVIMGMRK